MESISDLNDMVLFARVVDHGGYTAAARVLGLQTSRLSRRINQLEQELGVRLLNRTTRRISLTEAGQSFYGHCVAVAGEASAARQAIDQARATPRGLVRLSCPSSLLGSLAAAMIADYLAANPLVRIELMAVSRQVDLVEEGIDVAMRVRTPPLEDSDLVVRPLGLSTMVLVASPALLARFGRPDDLAALAALPTVSMPHSGERHHWEFKASDDRRISFAHVPRLITDDMPSLREAALKGVGVAYMPKAFVHDVMARGELLPLLPGLVLPQGVLHLVYASRRGLVPSVRGLIDALVQGFEKTIDFDVLQPATARG